MKMNKPRVKHNICDICIIHLENLGLTHFHEYYLTISEYANGKIRCVHESCYNKDVIKELELLGYLITTEYLDHCIKIKPKGIIQLGQDYNLYCIDQKHKNPNQS